MPVAAFIQDCQVCLLNGGSSGGKNAVEVENTSAVDTDFVRPPVDTWTKRTDPTRESLSTSEAICRLVKCAERKHCFYATGCWGCLTFQLLAIWKKFRKGQSGEGRQAGGTKIIKYLSYESLQSVTSQQTFPWGCGWQSEFCEFFSVNGWTPSLSVFKHMRTLATPGPFHENFNFNMSELSSIPNILQLVAW